MATDANTPLSNHFTLGDLCVTNQTLQNPNLPSTQDQMNNLSVLAGVLDQLTDGLGAFQILSGFRTAELENVLATQGEPVASGTSFHEVGRAVDISPTSDTIQAYIGKILANDALRASFAEIILKASQNALHLAVNTPDDTRTPKVLELTGNTYLPMADAEIEQLVTPYLTDVTQAPDIASSVNTTDPTVYILGAAAIFVLYIMMAKPARSSGAGVMA